MRKIPDLALGLRALITVDPLEIRRLTASKHGRSVQRTWHAKGLERSGRAGVIVDQKHRHKSIAQKDLRTSPIRMSGKTGNGTTLALKGRHNMSMNRQTTPNFDHNQQMNARIDLAAAHRQAVNDGFIEGIDNHFTLTVPGHSDRFYLNAFGLHWSEVKASNLIEVTLDGQVVSGKGIANLSAVSIHAPMHRRGFACVLHTHMPYATALSQLEDMTLEPSSQNGMVLHELLAYDYNYNGLADTQEEGERLADVLGDKQILMLANHGVVTTGETVAEAYHRLYFLERAAMTQMIAMAAGKRRMIADEVLAKSRSTLQTCNQQFTTEINLYFDAVKRLLNSQGSNYAN